MLTSKLVRVRVTKNSVLPLYMKHDDADWLAVCEQLVDLFRDHQGKSRSELEAELSESFGNLPNQLIYQGLAKLLEDRCDFETVAGHSPPELREAVFAEAAKQRRKSAFDRDEVLSSVARQFSVDTDQVEHGLFADLKSEQQLMRFKDTTAERLLQRYNVALAQAVLFRATGVEAVIRNEPPRRFRQLLRQVKFRRLMCDAESAGKNIVKLKLDGPLSLFSATQKYGLQLAQFLPSLLLCENFELTADLRWGPQRTPKQFRLSHEDGLVSHASDTGMYVPPELAMFVELFRKKVTTWDIQEEVELFNLGKHFWVPDFRLEHRDTGKVVYLEVLGFWRRSSCELHLQRLRDHAKQPFVLAVSEQLKVDDADLEGLPAEIHRFKQMPLPEEVARLAEGVIRA